MATLYPFIYQEAVIKVGTVVLLNGSDDNKRENNYLVLGFDTSPPQKGSQLQKEPGFFASIILPGAILSIEPVYYVYGFEEIRGVLKHTYEPELVFQALCKSWLKLPSFDPGYSLPEVMLNDFKELTSSKVERTIQLKR